MILILKHIAIEGPGTLKDYLDEHHIEHKIVELSQGERLPADLKGIDGVIVLGGPMNVYEEKEHPFLKDEDIFIRRIVKAGLPYLGICLGSQLLAKSCDAKVSKAAQKEIGWSFIEQTPEGKSDPLFNGLNDQLVVFQWHEDTFEIPSQGSLLSTSSVCAHQAFRVGDNAYGLQYHVEVDKRIIASWVKRYFNKEQASDTKEGEKMLEQYDQLKVQFNLQSRRMYENFIQIVKAAKLARTSA